MGQRTKHARGNTRIGYAVEMNHRDYHRSQEQKHLRNPGTQKVHAWSEIRKHAHV